MQYEVCVATRSREGEEGKDSCNNLLTDISDRTDWKAFNYGLESDKMGTRESGRWTFEVPRFKRIHRSSDRLARRTRGAHNLPRLSDVNDSNERNRSELASIGIEISRYLRISSSRRAG